MSVESVQQRLLRLSTRIGRCLRQSDSPLSAAQQSLLEALVASGPLTIGALARRDRVSPATVSRIIDTLEGRNLVRRARDKRDRRIVYAVVTREGRGLLEHSRRDSKRLGNLLTDLGQDKIRVLDQKLRVIEGILFE